MFNYSVMHVWFWQYHYLNEMWGGNPSCKLFIVNKSWFLESKGKSRLRLFEVLSEWKGHEKIWPQLPTTDPSDSSDWKISGPQGFCSYSEITYHLHVRPSAILTYKWEKNEMHSHCHIWNEKSLQGGHSLLMSWKDTKSLL